MSVAAPEAPTNTDGSSLEEDPPDSPPETARYRNLYIVLLVCGFILRFLLSARKFATSPSTSFACSVSVHPFPRTLDRPPGSLPFILNLAALVFRLFGMYSGGLRDRAAWHSVHHRRHRHHHPRSGPPHAGCANRILHGVPAHLGLSFSTWDEQVEQDRAPPFFLHLIELARASHCEITKPSSISLPRRRPRLQVTCRLDRRKYPTGRKVSKEEMKGIHLQPDRFHGGWNYVIRPHQSRDRQRMEIGRCLYLFAQPYIAISTIDCPGALAGHSRGLTSPPARVDFLSAAHLI